MSVKIPSTNSSIVNGAKLDFLMGYPPQALLLDFFDFTTSILTVSPRKNRNGVDDYVISVNNVLYENLYSSLDTIDLTSTGISGLVDGITFTAANARDFLIWGLFSDSNGGSSDDFLGFGVTHKPYSAYTAPASASKGASASFTVTNGFQFTEGARVSIRNTVGTALLYQWNWGTITSINSNTSITVLMDNNSNYGLNLTAATGGEITQWDMFRPWVVGTDQELYSGNYRLLGELYTNASGNITQAFRVDDPWRNISLAQILDNSTAAISGIIFSSSLGRHIPLWAKQGNFLVIAANTTPDSLYSVYCTSSGGGNSLIQIGIVAASYGHRAFVPSGMNSDCSIIVSSGNTSTNESIRVWITGYYTPGGMRI